MYYRAVSDFHLQTFVASKFGRLYSCHEVCTLKCHPRIKIFKMQLLLTWKLLHGPGKGEKRAVWAAHLWTFNANKSGRLYFCHEFCTLKCDPRIKIFKMLLLLTWKLVHGPRTGNSVPFELLFNDILVQLKLVDCTPTMSSVLSNVTPGSKVLQCNYFSHED